MGSRTSPAHERIQLLNVSIGNADNQTPNDQWWLRLKGGTSARGSRRLSLSDGKRSVMFDWARWRLTCGAREKWISDSYFQDLNGTRKCTYGTIDDCIRCPFKFFSLDFLRINAGEKEIGRVFSSRLQSSRVLKITHFLWQSRFFSKRHRSILLRVTTMTSYKHMLVLVLSMQVRSLSSETDCFRTASLGSRLMLGSVSLCASCLGSTGYVLDGSRRSRYPREHQYPQ